MSKILIPREQIEIRTARSSGPGGQAVNKTASKAEIRFHVNSAQWIPDEVRARLLHLAHNRMNQEGELILSSQESRSQHANIERCFQKLAALLEQAARPPKQRRPTRPTRGSQKKRLDSKTRRGQTKRLRSYRGSSNE